MSLRTKKVEKELQSIVASYLQTSFPYRNEVIVSISNVVVSSDLKQAKIYYSYYSPLHDEVDKNEVQDILVEERVDIQNKIAHELKMKFTPKLKFFYDDSFAEQFDLQNKLKKLGFEQSI